EEPLRRVLEQLEADPTLLFPGPRTGDGDGPVRITWVRSLLGPAESPAALGTLGDYEVSEVLGQGGMGLVLKAFDAALRRPVAIKVLTPDFAGDPLARKRFAREAQAA